MAFISRTREWLRPLAASNHHALSFCIYFQLKIKLFALCHPAAQTEPMTGLLILHCASGRAMPNLRCPLSGLQLSLLNYVCLLWTQPINGCFALGPKQTARNKSLPLPAVPAGHFALRKQNQTHVKLNPMENYVHFFHA